MKKSIFLSVLVATLFFIPVAGFAAETAAKDATDKIPPALETSPNPSAELQKDKQDALKKDDSAVNETKNIDKRA